MDPKGVFVPDGVAARPARGTQYEKPVLQVYGELTEITQSMMGSMARDGVAHPNMHFTS